jgi:hypothetical protein
MRINNYAVLVHFGPFYVPNLAKAFFRKHECLKRGHATAPIGAGCTPLKTANHLNSK